MKNSYLNGIYQKACQRDAGKTEYLQALREVLESIEPAIDKHPEFEKHGIVQRLIEPDRMIQFRVPWMDDDGKVQVNRGYRVQYNSAIGPYKGGMRFHPSVNASIMKFLGFEQTFKNCLTTLPMGGGKGGSDFDPKGKSDMEVLRFCQSLMNEMHRHIGQFTDVPAGDIGVGARELGYMYGQYKRICNEVTGVITGKSIDGGGSLGRTEATGYGLVYFVQEMLGSMKKESVSGKTAVVSGSGNVATYAVQKLQQCGAKVVAMSDSDGYIYDPKGINLDVIRQIKEVDRGRISEYAHQVPGSQYKEGCTGIWTIKCNIALPCATQNELDTAAAQALVDNGVIAVAEGSNMPCTPGAVEIFHSNGILFAPGKASNAGGVAVSGLEMTQNSIRMSWTFEEVDAKLQTIMKDIFHNAYNASVEYGHEGNLVVGANIASFLKIARAMLWMGPNL